MPGSSLSLQKWRENGKGEEEKDERLFLSISSAALEEGGGEKLLKKKRGNLRPCLEGKKSEKKGGVHFRLLYKRGEEKTGKREKGGEGGVNTRSSLLTLGGKTHGQTIRPLTFGEKKDPWGGGKGKKGEGALRYSLS